MPLQDLTPELRTRLSRVERSVGWFVIIATIVLIVGFGYYLYATAQNRGWFVTKINYATALNDFSGFKIGDPVKIMGFPAGEITCFSLISPDKPRGVRIFFTIRDPYYQYIWYDSAIAVKSDLLGNRFLEVSKGQSGVPTVLTNKLLVLQRLQAYQEFKSIVKQLHGDPANKELSETQIMDMATNELMNVISNHVDIYYTNAHSAEMTTAITTDPGPRHITNYCWIPLLDAPTIEDRLGAVASEIEQAVPNVLKLTNELAGVLSNANNAVAHLDGVLAKAEPVVDNLNTITGNLKDPNGSLGNWIIPTNLASQLHDTLHSATAALNSAHATLDDTDTNVTKLATDLDQTLIHLADLTSNLASQVHANSNLVGDIAVTIVHTDDLVQGLKREWFLRGPFKTKKAKKTNDPPASIKR